MSRLSSDKSLSIVCYLAAVIALLFGYAQGMAGWLAAVFPLLFGLCAWMVTRFGWLWLPDALLVLSTCAAAGGILLGAPAAWMVLGATLFLAGWELFRHAGYQQNRENERAHHRLLATALGFGLVLAEIGLLIHLALPFAVIILAGLLVIASLYRLYRVLNRPSA